MPLLSTKEAVNVSDAFLYTLYGDELFQKWTELKIEMQFVTERDYVAWLVEVAQHYKTDVLYAEGSGVDMVGSEYIGQDHMAPPQQIHIPNTVKQSPLKKHHTQKAAPVKSETRTMQHNSSGVHVKADEVAGGVPGQYSDEAAAQAGILLQQQQPTQHQAQFDSSFQLEFSESNRSHAVPVSDGGGGGVVARMETEEVNISSGDEEDHNNTTDANLLSLCVVGDAAAGGQGEGNGENKRYHCPHCTYQTCSLTNIRRHITGTHKRLKPYACPHCAYSSSQKVTLNSHLVARHCYRAKYTCSSCGKGFNVPSKCEKHSEKCSTMPPPRPSDSLVKSKA